MLLIAEVVGKLAVEGALNQRFGEMLKQAILTEQVFWLLVIFGNVLICVPE